jgi:hypothetical protein
MKYYAGIGARFASEEILEECTDIGEAFGAFGYTLRSGHANGCDLSFEYGCNKNLGLKEIYLPWKNFNGSDSPYYLTWDIPEKLAEIAKTIYPHWDKVRNAIKSLHARNVQQILGKNADSKSDFVVCYTDRSYDDPTQIGGTMFGIKLAQANNIPVYNLFLKEEKEKFYEFMKSF